MIVLDALAGLLAAIAIIWWCERPLNSITVREWERHGGRLPSTATLVDTARREEALSDPYLRAAWAEVAAWEIGEPEIEELYLQRHCAAPVSLTDEEIALMDITDTYIGALMYNTSNFYGPWKGQLDEPRMFAVGGSDRKPIAPRNRLVQ